MALSRVAFAMLRCRWQRVGLCNVRWAACWLFSNVRKVNPLRFFGRVFRMLRTDVCKLPLTVWEKGIQCFLLVGPWMPNRLSDM